MPDKQVIVRFPPSPTGPFHVGGVRTALYNYLFARQNGGKFLLRIEDTDKERSRKEFEDDIYDSLNWLGFEHDGEVLKQSERTEIYKNKIQELIKSGAAYISEESEGENKHVVRFKNPGGKIKFNDLIRGEIEMDTSDLKDFIIAKNIDEPLYHLTVVVDDMESGVTHVIRGEDHISNTPRQILILEALGGERPIYAHLPLILAPDKSKLSKRKHGESVSLKYYRDLGYEKEAIINFMALIGWNPGGEKEIFSLKELIKIFDISKVQKKGGIFDVEKLNWMNKEYISKMDRDTQLKHLKAQMGDKFDQKYLNLFLERIHKWSDVGKLISIGEFDYLFKDPEVSPSSLLWKNHAKEKARSNLEKVLEMIGEKDKIMELAEQEGKGDVLWPLRVALSGKEKSPDPFTLIDILGNEVATNRVRKAIEILN